MGQVEVGETAPSLWSYWACPKESCGLSVLASSKERVLEATRNLQPREAPERRRVQGSGL